LLKGQTDGAEKYLALSKRKLTRTKGWPIEREHQVLVERLQLLASLRSEAAKLTKL
jgi:hypothetical protein